MGQRHAAGIAVVRVPGVKTGRRVGGRQPRHAAVGRSGRTRPDTGSWDIASCFPRQRPGMNWRPLPATARPRDRATGRIAFRFSPLQARTVRLSVHPTNDRWLPRDRGTRLMKQRAALLGRESRRRGVRCVMRLRITVLRTMQDFMRPDGELLPVRPVYNEADQVAVLDERARPKGTRNPTNMVARPGVGSSTGCAWHSARLGRALLGTPFVRATRLLDRPRAPRFLSLLGDFDAPGFRSKPREQLRGGDRSIRVRGDGAPGSGTRPDGAALLDAHGGHPREACSSADRICPPAPAFAARPSHMGHVSPRAASGARSTTALVGRLTTSRGAHAPAQTQVLRLAVGPDRYATAVRASQVDFASTGSRDLGERPSLYPDALSASGTGKACSGNLCCSHDRTRPGR